MRKHLLRAFAIMMIFLITIPALLYYFRPSETDASWYNDSWQYRKLITINKSKVPTAQINFPIMVKTIDTDLKQSARQDGFDILFTLASNSAKLAHEIESYASASGTLVAWVKIPTLSSTTDTNIYMYYGNPSSANQQDNAGVWDSSYKLVQHMEESSNATTITDSTGASSNNATKTGSPYLGITGKIGKGALLFDDSYFDNTTSTVIPHNSNITFEMWVNPDSAVNGAEDIFRDYPGTYTNSSWGIQRCDADACGPSTPEGLADFELSEVHDYYTTSALFTNSTWQHIVVTYNGTDAKFYKNGSHFETISSAQGQARTPTGYRIGNGGLYAGFSGSIDEIRVSNTPRTADWITTSYNNQSDPSSFFSTGTEERKGDPALYLSFDEGYGTIAHNTGNNNPSMNGTLTNMSSPPSTSSGWFNNGKFGKALKFDGENDYVVVADHDSIDYAKDQNFTVSAWFKAPAAQVSTSGDTQNSIVEKWSGSGGYPYVIRINNSTNGSPNKITAGRYDGSNNPSMLSDNTLNDNKWHHVIFSKSGSTLSLYIDGILNSTVTDSTTGTTTNSSPLGIGAYGNGISPFTGQIDEVRVYDYPLTADQIKVDYNRHASAVIGQDTSKSTLFDGLVGYWKLDDGVNNPCPAGVDKACDSSGNNYTGTWQNGAASTSGKFANGINFDGNNDYITMGDVNAVDGLTALTVSAWINTTQVSEGHIAGKSSCLGGVNGGVFELLVANGNLKFVIFKNGGSPDFIQIGSSITINDAKWHHATGAYDGSDMSVYVDGINYGSTHIPNITMPSLSNNLELGGRCNGNNIYFNGQVDDVRIYNRSLSPAEIGGLAEWGPEPAGWWKFDDNAGTSAIDSSGNGNTVTFASSPSAPSWTTGKFGPALSFDGSDDFATAADSSTLDISTSTTLSAWVYPRAFPGAGNFDTFIMKEDAPANYYMELKDTDEFDCGFSNGDNDSNNANLATNTWYYLSCVFDDSTDTVKVYLNGVLNNTITGVIGTQTPNNDPLYIGKFVGGQHTNAKLDDIKLYNYARSQKQIITDMNAGHPAVGSPVGSAVGHWKFDEGFGTVVNNSGACATCSGNMTAMDSPATYGSGWTNNGKFGKALSFDGYNDVVMVPYNPALNITGDITLSAWIKKNADGVEGEIITKGADDNNPWDYGLYINNSNYLVLYSDYTSPVSLTSNSSITGKEWHHVLVTRNGSTVTLYIDGKLDKSGTMTGSFDSGQNNVHIGKGGDISSGATFNGALDEVKVYNYALSADEVKTEYNHGKSLVMGAISTSADGKTASNAASRAYCVPGDTATCNPPIGHWTLDERAGTVANDNTGNNNAGTLTNGPVWSKGKIGSGINFDGNDDVVSIPHSDIYDKNISAITVESWFKFDRLGSETGNVGNVAIKLNTVAPNYSWQIYIGTDDTLVFEVKNTTPALGYVDSGNVLKKNQWYHAAGTWQAGQSPKLYVNSVDVSSNQSGAPGGTLYDTNDVLGIGGDTGSDNMDGTVDDVRVYNYARTPAQIAWDYNRGDPLAHWRFDECQGTVATDTAPKSDRLSLRFDGIIYTGDASGDNDTTGTCNSGNTTEMWNDGTTGKHNSGLGFDGTNDYVEMTGAALNLTGDKSVEAWIYPSSFDEDGGNNDRRIIFNRIDVNTIYQLTLIGQPSHTPTGFMFIVTDGGVEYAFSNQNNGGGYATNRWYHLVGTYNDITHAQALYVNGAQVTDSGISGWTTGTTGNLQIGKKSDNTGYFPGKIDDVKIYNYIVTPLQVKLFYNENSAVRFAP